MPPDRTLQLRYPLPGKLSENEAQSGINVVPVAVAASDKIVDFANCMRYSHTDAPIYFSSVPSAESMLIGNLEYPLDDNSRRKFKLKSGKVRHAEPNDNKCRDPTLISIQMPSAHQWAVYDFVRKIPVGKVTTYKASSYLHSDVLNDEFPTAYFNCYRSRFTPFRYGSCILSLLFTA